MSVLDKMNFNPYAFVAPKTKEEYAALLQEAHSLLDQLNEQFDAIFKACEEGRNKLT